MQNYLLTALDDGERVVTERLDGVRSVAIGFWIGAGSRDEDEGRAGVTHFLEHLLFKGTKSYSAQDIAEVFDGLGGELNAATTREYTLVYARVMDEHLETALDVMTDMVFAPTLADLDAEREVVLEEIAMVRGQPAGPRARPVHASDFRLAPARATRDRPSRRHLARSRDAPSSPTTGHGTWRTTSSSRLPGMSTTIASSSSARGWQVRRRRLRPGRRGRGPCSMRRRAPSVAFRRRTLSSTTSASARPVSPALTLAASRPRSSTASSAARRRRGSSRRFARSGASRTRCSRSPPRTPTRARSACTSGTREENLATCLEIVAREIADVAQGGVADTELRRAKENLKGRIMLSMESTGSRMNRLGKSVITDSEILSLDRILAEIEAVEVDGVATLAASLLAPDRLSAAGIGPSEARFSEALAQIVPGLVDNVAA